MRKGSSKCRAASRIPDVIYLFTWNFVIPSRKYPTI